MDWSTYKKLSEQPFVCENCGIKTAVQYSHFSRHSLDIEGKPKVICTSCFKEENRRFDGHN